MEHRPRRAPPAPKIPLVAILAILARASPAADAIPVDVTADATVTRSKETSLFDRTTNKLTSTADITVRNASAAAFGPPVHAVFDVQVLDGADPALLAMPGAAGGPGTQPYGTYYVDLTGSLPAAGLVPGASVTFPVKFVRASAFRFTYAVRIFAVRSSPPSNLPPVFTSTPETEAVVGDFYAYRAVAADPEGGAVAYKLDKAPEGTAIAADGTIEYLPSDQALGKWDVVVRATDPRGASSTQSYALTVRKPNLSPIITSMPVTWVKAGDTYGYKVEAYEPEGEPVTFEFLDPPPAGMTIGKDSGQIEWPTTMADLGRHEISVLAKDPGTGVDGQWFSIDVIADPLRITSPRGDFDAVVGTELVLPLAANYANAVFSVDPMPANAKIDGANFRFTPAKGQEGPHPLSFTARFAGMTDATLATVTVRVTNEPPVLAVPGPQSVLEGGELRFTVTATDADGDRIALSAPGLAIQNAVFNENTGEFLFLPASGQAGGYSVTFRASDGTAKAEGSVAIAVEKGAPPPGDALDLALDKPQSPTFSPKATVSGSVKGQAVVQPPSRLPPLVTSLVPVAGQQGTSIRVEIGAVGTGFTAGAVTADFGAGTSIAALEILSSATARATVVIDPQADLGPRQVRLSQGGTRIDSVVAFAIEKGAASLSGVVIDPFTKQPLAGALVIVDGTNVSATTDAAGKFSLAGVPPGPANLIVTLQNYSVGMLTIDVYPGSDVAVDAPIELNALVRPPGPGGSLPRAATVASVLDRGAATLHGGLTLEQAKAVVSDTMIAVGGDEAGVLDEAGNQLNPKVAGAGLVSLTPIGVERQAKALIGGDVYTLNEFLTMLTSIFKFTPALSVEELIGYFQQYVNES